MFAQDSLGREFCHFERMQKIREKIEKSWGGALNLEIQR